VISADSRQVFRGMNIGTGKDYKDYTLNGIQIPYHLIDIEEPGAEYNIFRYQQDFLVAFNKISSHGKLPILCGGSGMYLEAILKGYQLTEAKPDQSFLQSIEKKNDVELETMLRFQKPLHNTTDLEDRSRMIRALAIEHQVRLNIATQKDFPSFPRIRSMIIGITFPRGLLKNRITDRLGERLEQGMMKEIEKLLNTGLKPERLIRYGLEYKFGTEFITGMISYEEMFLKLNKAIHQFAKRQMTWFRRMERQGLKINWLDGRLPLEEKLKEVIRLKELF